MLAEVLLANVAVGLKDAGIRRAMGVDGGYIEARMDSSSDQMR